MQGWLEENNVYGREGDVWSKKKLGVGKKTSQITKTV